MNNRPILPGATIGVLGSGQLGRMLAVAARQMGYNLHVLSPGTNTPTGQLADREISADYDDLDAVAAFAKQVDVVTYEFENVPAATAECAAQYAPLRPGKEALRVSQNRIIEKESLTAANVPVAPYCRIDSYEQLQSAVRELGLPAILKRATTGYDGKGQVRIDFAADVATAWQSIGATAAVLETVVDFEREVSVVAARGLDGTTVDYGLIENDHVNHILDVSTAPAPVPEKIVGDARAIAETILTHLDFVGVLCVEFFLTADGELLVNEIAPRPHNSGHLTIDGCVTSQFEQQLRAICGLPLGATTLRQPTVMVNLLGDLWQPHAPDWVAATSDELLRLHLYGKAEPRIGRKMGHMTVSAATVAEARQRALAARERLMAVSQANVMGGHSQLRHAMAKKVRQ